MKTAKPLNLQRIHLLSAIAAVALPMTAGAGFSLPSGSTSPGHGISNVLSGSIANGALYFQSTTNWLNTANPIQTYGIYAITNDYSLPVCDSVAVARIVMTLWGGNANYVSEMTVTINGTNLPAASPFIFGTTNDANPVFSATSANAYGSGSGVWLVTLPVPPEMLFKNGVANTIVVSQTSTNNFDGRVQHVSLLAVYQRADLANTFDYAIAEGSGDIFKTPSGTQVSQRSVAFAAVNPANATSATLTALYTYGDALNDRLYFNGVQCGSDNVADWNTSVANYGPSVVSFDVLAHLAASNTVTFSLGPEVPTPEASLRPQLAALAVTRAAAALPMLTINGAGQIAWPTNSAGFVLESTGDLAAGAWSPVMNTPAVNGSQFTVTVDLNSPQRLYRLHKTN